MNPILLIPARMASTRLPGKPLAAIAGRPMIVRVWECAMAANLGPVVVAAAEPEIVAAIEAAGGRAILTDPGLASGSDRIFAALKIGDALGRQLAHRLGRAVRVGRGDGRERRIDVVHGRLLSVRPALWTNRPGVFDRPSERDVDFFPER